MENRRFDHQSDVGGIGRERLKCGAVVNPIWLLTTICIVPPVRWPLRPDRPKAFGHNALACKGRIAVQQNRQDLGAVCIAELVLLGADLAQHNRVDRLKVAGVCGQRQVDRSCRQTRGRRGAEVIFHVARAIDIFGFEAAALKFVEDRADRVCSSRWPAR